MRGTLNQASTSLSVFSVSFCGVKFGFGTRRSGEEEGRRGGGYPGSILGSISGSISGSDPGSISGSVSLQIHFRILSHHSIIFLQPTVHPAGLTPIHL